MRKQFIAIMCLVFLCMLTACSGTDQAKLDIYQYLNEDVRQIVATQNKAVSKYNAFMEMEEADPEQLISALEQEILPAMQEAQTALSALHYESDEVNDFVEQYGQVLAAEENAMEEVRKAVNEKSETGLTQANAQIQEAMTAMDEYQAAVRSFAAGHGISIVVEEE